jgi:inosose dehydratase
MTKEAGVKYICLKDVHLPYKSTPAQRQDARRKIEAAGLVLMGGGVIYMNTKEDEVRALFEYAQDAGMPTVVCSPDPAALDTVEKMAKHYKIRVAIHNHGPGDKRYPSPLDVFKMVKDRDELLGICMDVGHTVRIGEDPVAVLKQCASRMYDFHIKDVTEATAKGGAIEVGKGVIDTAGVLKTLVGLKFPYHVALEYEANGDAPMPGIVGSFATMRRLLAAMD